MVLMQWSGFLFFYSYYKFRQEEVQTKITYMMLLCYVHYIPVSLMYYKDANGRMLAVCKLKQRFS